MLVLGQFLYSFGQPAWQRYQEKKVIVVTARRETEGTTIPAVALLITGVFFRVFLAFGRNVGNTGKLSTMAEKDDKSETITPPTHTD